MSGRFGYSTPRIRGMYYYRGPVLEEKVKQLTLSAANTFTQETIDCPVQQAVNLSMLLHDFKVTDRGLDTMADGDYTFIQITDRSCTGKKYLSDAELIAGVERWFGLVTSGAVVYDKPHWHRFTKPKIYGRAKMYLAGITAGQAAVTGFDCAVGYTLAQVSPYRMIDALTQE